MARFHAMTNERMRDVVRLMESRRVELGLTMAAVAEKAGITERALRTLKSPRRRNPTLSTLVGLAHALGLSLEELIAGVSTIDAVMAKAAASEGRATNERMPFNINDCIWVRLTDLGREVHAAHYRDSEYKPALREVDGYTCFQAWEAMCIFGRRMGNGFPLVFETNVLIEADVLADVRGRIRAAVEQLDVLAAGEASTADLLQVVATLKGGAG